MRIASINGQFSVQKADVKRNQNKTNLQTNLVNYSSKPAVITSPYLGRDLISFKATTSTMPYNASYFHLPQGCEPDEFQVEAGKALSAGKDVLVEAPTGTGKTAIAHYATSQNMEKGKTTFYTTPLKALSNQKLNEFRKVYGEDKVGILTGDRRENVKAPIIIMTTEVYRNMALSDFNGEKSPIMKNLGTVIFDEFHYLGDESRGPVWEESIMYTPKDVQTLELSATIGNTNELANWIGSLNADNVETVSIPRTRRAVPLVFDVLETAAFDKSETDFQKQLKRTGSTSGMSTPKVSPKPVLSDFKAAIEKLEKKEQLPAILFIFSKRYSRELLEYLGSEGPELTTKEEQKQIEEIVKNYSSEKYLGFDVDMDSLKKGYAIHNAGIMPQQKELIEELFQKKLLKVVISTETLAAGINMPAKTVVISNPYKPTDDEKAENNMRILTPNEFKQMAGRAGRRGIDTVGYVYTMPTDRVTQEEFMFLEYSDSNPIKSKYNPDYAFLSGYYENNEDNSKLNDIYSKTFFAFNKNKGAQKQKVNELLDASNKKANVMLQRGFLEKQDGKMSATLLGKMASKVRGYDALTLAESMNDKLFNNVAPESLAMIAAAMANPATGKEPAVGVNDDMFFVYEDALDSVYTVKKETEKFVASTLKKLGKEMRDFPYYEEMLEYAKAIEQPEVDQADMKVELDRLLEIQNKLHVINDKTTDYTEEMVVAALKQGECVPSKVLQEHLEKTEDFKRRNNIQNFDYYIEKLNSSQIKDVKGKKAKEKNDEKIREQKEKVAIAKHMKFLDENLMSEISSNYRFAKKYNEKDIMHQLYDLEQTYTKAASKDDLIKAIKGLIDIDNHFAHNNIDDENAQNRTIGPKTLQKIMTKAVQINATEQDNGIKSKVDEYGKVSAQIAYTWAFLNKVNSDSKSNWNKLVRMIPESSADEGSIYRTVMQTADMLSQMQEMANVGFENAQTKEDRDYYKALVNNLDEARQLLIKEPIEI